MMGVRLKYAHGTRTLVLFADGIILLFYLLRPADDESSKNPYYTMLLMSTNSFAQRKPNQMARKTPFCLIEFNINVIYDFWHLMLLLTFVVAVESCVNVVCTGRRAQIFL